MNNDTLREKYESLRTQARQQLIFLARSAQRKDKKLGEFVCAMGSASFDGDLEMKRPASRPVSEFLGEWDNVFHLTGHPMRFKPCEPIVSDW